MRHARVWFPILVSALIAGLISVGVTLAGGPPIPPDATPPPPQQPRPPERHPGNAPAGQEMTGAGLTVVPTG